MLRRCASLAACLLVARPPAPRSLPAAQLPGWTTLVDQDSGSTYFCNEQTGQCQWEPPDSGAQMIWRVVPTAGVLTDHAVRGGEEQVLGRFDMADPSPYVSRKQCLVQVAANGSGATLVSTGKPLTLYRAHSSAPWYVLRKSRPLGDDIGYDDATTHALSDGEQISIDMRNPEGAIFTVCCCQADGSAGGTDDRVQYSEDGLWVWNGAEWVPSGFGLGLGTSRGRV